MTAGRVNRRRRAAVIGWMACVVLLGCGSDGITGSGSAPADHTVSKSGAMHKPGLQDAAVNCTSCHGADLTGGPAGQPSCYACHGKRWN